MYPDLAHIKSLHSKYAASDKAFDIVFTHCQIVWEIAGQLIAKNSLKVDTNLVQAGALLHDIGAYKFLDADGIFDEDNYLKHGVEGYQILKLAGLPESICRIAERHTGVGITQNQIISNKLPLPVKDYTAETDEEKLVMYADKFHSKPFKFNSFAEYSQSVSKFGEESRAKFQQLAEKFGLPDLNIISKKYRHP